MKRQDDNQIEVFIQSFSCKPAPSDLKNRILRVAHQEKEAARGMTPGLWKILFGCMICLAAFTSLDMKFMKDNRERIASLISLAPISGIQKGDDSVKMLAELFNVPANSEFLSWVGKRYGIEKKTKTSLQLFSSTSDFEGGI